MISTSRKQLIVDGKYRVDFNAGGDDSYFENTLKNKNYEETGEYMNSSMQRKREAESPRSKKSKKIVYIADQDDHFPEEKISSPKKH